jgi:uncharacterized membrane protein YukC
MSGGDFRSQKQIAQGGGNRSFADEPVLHQLAELHKAVQFMQEDFSDLKNQMDVEVRNLHDIIESLSAADTEEDKEKKKKKKDKKKKKEKKLREGRPKK